LHVAPEYHYVSGNSTVEEHLLVDFMQSVKPWVSTLIENYRVLIYSGQNDIILSAPICENFLAKLRWDKSHLWQTAPRDIWRVDSSDYAPAGYIKRQQSPIDQPGLLYAIVRDAGHLVPQDQPERAFDLISRFVDKKPFNK
jgi:vitellogenic carboxypeptidase-like protein